MYLFDERLLPHAVNIFMDAVQQVGKEFLTAAIRETKENKLNQLFRATQHQMEWNGMRWQKLALPVHGGV